MRGRGAVRSMRGSIQPRAADDEASKIDISLAEVERGARIGQGNFGEVFEGKWQGKRVVLKSKKSGLRVGLLGFREEVFRNEAAIARRLGSNKGVVPFLGVAGADAYLVWEYEGKVTLADVMKSKNCLKDLARMMKVRGDGAAVKTFAKKLLGALKQIHGTGVVHRDVKPANILITDKGDVRLIDLGACADLRTGTNFSQDEGFLDPLYGPPEQTLGFSGGLFGWAKSKPDLFDSYSAGLVILQLACPGLRNDGALRTLRKTLGKQPLMAWRHNYNGKESDLELLNENGGKAWDLLTQLIAPKDKRKSVGSALNHPWLLF